jgi:hypothetical protein
MHTSCYVNMCVSCDILPLYTSLIFAPGLQTIQFSYQVQHAQLQSMSMAETDLRLMEQDLLDPDGRRPTFGTRSPFQPFDRK